MKIGLFLGAGASVPFGMPTTEGLRSKIQKFGSVSREEEVLQSFLTNPKYPDIEYVLQAVSDVIKFSRSRGGDFFFSHGSGSLRFDSGTLDFNQFINKVVQVEADLEGYIYENYRWKSSYKPQVKEIYDEIFSFLKSNSDSIRIFTTNYDRIIEEFCHSRGHYRLVDGFERNPTHSEISKWTGNFEVDNRDGITNVYLYKLHGSLNWKEHEDHGIIKTNEESKSPDSNFKRNLVVMPTLSPKEEEEVEPFSSIISEFEKNMMKLDGLIVIGFSFRDQGINRIFNKFIQSGKALVVLSPSSMKNVCQNLLHFDVPKNYDKNKVSSQAPSTGHVWCIPHKLGPQSIKSDLETVALIHIKKSFEMLNNLDS